MAATGGIQHSYLITNRNMAKCADEPLPNNGLLYYEAPFAYNPNSASYQAVNTMPTDLLSDLAAIATGPSGALSAALVVYIHGLANLFDGAVKETAELGLYLTSYEIPDGPQFSGSLLIGFDWPSFGLLQSVGDYGKIRTNIQNSVGSFGVFLQFLEQLQTQARTNSPSISLSISFICHSEGNYMMMEGFAGADVPNSLRLDQVLLLAADINDAALQNPAAGSNEGTGSQIAAAAACVTVYYSAFDTDLIVSERLYTCYHNPSYPGRLGLTGPVSYVSLESIVVAVDCSKVVNEIEEWYLKVKGDLLLSVDLHSSYRYVPQILTDMIQTLSSTAAGSVVNRVANGNSGQDFSMNVDPRYAIHLPLTAARGTGGLALPLLLDASSTSRTGQMVATV